MEVNMTHDQPYYYINDRFIITETSWTGSKVDYARYVVGNVFESRRDTEKRHDWIFDRIQEVKNGRV